MNQRKSLKELNLLDKFLFDEAMDDPENVKTMLDIILSHYTNLKHPPQTEKEQRTATDNRQIRLDVYAIDEDDVIYEVEAKKENTHNLPKRSRLYQGIIDSKLLPPGVADFNLLNEVLIVLITPFDLFGYGFLNSRQKHFYLPEPQTDFIFSIISEEFGFMGILIVASLFLFIIYRGFMIARNSSNLFQKYVAFGITFQIAFQSILNLMVVVGLIPVTGVTLPFLSYGGSSLLITLCSVGILLNISRNNK